MRRIKNGDVIELRLSHAHGSRHFGPVVSDDLDYGEHRDWAVLQVARAGKHRGVPAAVLFEVDVPIAELGKLVAGQTARGAADWCAPRPRPAKKGGGR